eukprot:g37261.t1
MRALQMVLERMRQLSPPIAIGPPMAKKLWPPIAKNIDFTPYLSIVSSILPIIALRMAADILPIVSFNYSNIADLLIALLPRTDLNCNHVISRTVTIIHCMPVISWSHSQSYYIFLHILE